MEPFIINRQARRDYTIIDQMEAGIVLSGQEVKSLRQKRASITQAFVRLIGSEVFLINAHIQPYQQVEHITYEPTQTRKLLLKRSQIRQLEEMLQTKGLTAIPLMIGESHHFLKVLVGIGKGKKQYERKEELKRRDLSREQQSILKGKR